MPIGIYIGGWKVNSMFLMQRDMEESSLEELEGQLERSMEASRQARIQSGKIIVVDGVDYFHCDWHDTFETFDEHFTHCQYCGGRNH